MEDKFNAAVLPRNLLVSFTLKGLLLSSKQTFTPCWANKLAREEPTTPAPTIVTSKFTLMILDFLYLEFP